MNYRGTTLLAVIGIVFVGLAAFLGAASSTAAQLSLLETVSVQPDAPQAPSINLTQTVGIDPAVCAATQTLNLPFGGGNVTYCYTVTNTGDTTLTLHTLTDSQLGTVLSNFAYSLSPGASAFLTQTATINTTTVNSATWIAFNPGPTDMTSDSDMVQVNVALAAPAIVLTKTVGLDPAVCATTSSLTLSVGGGNVTYCYTVKNTGNTTLTLHNLTDNQLGTVLSNFPYSLSPGASAFLTQTATITATTINSATWTAFNPGPTDSVQGTDIATVVIEHKLFLPIIARP